MGGGRLWLVQVCLAVGYLSLASGMKNPWLYYSSMGLTAPKTEGVYGGEIDIWVNGTASNLTQTGIYCANLRTAGFHTGFQVSSMAYDPVTEKAVVDLYRDSRYMSVFTTAMCHKGPPKCRNSKVKVYFASADPFYTDGDHERSTRGRTGPFAMWNNTLYFIVNIYIPRDGMLEHTIQLRKLENCEKQYPFTKETPNLAKCSTLTGIFAEELTHDIGAGFDMDTLASADHLFVFLKNDEKIFLTQIMNTTADDDFEVEHFTMMLVAFRPFEGKRYVLHTQDLPKSYADHRDSLRNIGGVSYRDDTVCWSTFDRIFCATWNGKDDLQNIIVVLPAGLASQICQVERGDFEGISMRNMVTGVTIGDATNNMINLFFGCDARTRHQGGAGFLRILKDGSHRQLFRVTDNDGPIFAGAMFLGCNTKHLYSSQAFAVTGSSMTLVPAALALLSHFLQGIL